MPEIINSDFNGLCCEEFCDQEHTNFATQTFGDMKVLIPLCFEHYNKFIDETLGK